MSAYMVSNDTISLLASIAAYWRDGHIYGGLDVTSVSNPLTLSDLIDANNVKFNDSPYRDGISYEWNYGGGTFSDLCRELYEGNKASLIARYGDSAAGMYQDYDDSDYSPILDRIAIGDVLGALRCYEYQSCEVRDYSDSFNKALLDAIARKVTGLYSTGWDYERPKNMPKVILLSELVR